MIGLGAPDVGAARCGRPRARCRGRVRAAKRSQSGPAPRPGQAVLAQDLLVIYSKAGER